MLNDDNIKDELLKALGKKIKKLRQGKGIRQNEIAYRCYFDKSSYNNIEAGKRNITIFTLYKISKALNVSLESLMKDL